MQTTVTRTDILGKAAMLKAVPTVSSVVDKVLGLISDPEAAFGDLSKVVSYDHSISSKIISIANSAYYSRGMEIYTLQRAMVIIGIEEVKKIIMCLVFMNNMLQGLKVSRKDLVDLWKHSVMVACAAKALARRTLTEEPQKAFTAGLLHDIGIDRTLYEHPGLP